MTDVDQIVKKLEKDFGNIGALSESDDFDIISTGLPSLDNILGIGGIPRGGFTEIYGLQSAAKSSLALKIVSEAQKLGLLTAYIDAERAMSKALALHAGVKLDDVVYFQPSHGEEAIDFILKIVEQGVKLIVVDSVTALIPRDEAEAGIHQQSIGLQARLMSKAARMLLGPVSKNNHNVAIVWVNQLRDDINKFGFGPKTTTSGGKALKYYSLLRIKLARIAWLARENQKTGMRLRATVEKNKLGVPQMSTDFNFEWLSGFNVGLDKLELLEKQGKVKKIAQTYYYNDEKIGTRSKAIEYIEANELL